MSGHGEYPKVPSSVSLYTLPVAGDGIDLSRCSVRMTYVILTPSGGAPFGDVGVMDYTPDHLYVRADIL